jgi:hypothetical protein
MKRQISKYECDVLGCETEREAQQGDPPPSGWGHIIVSRCRDHTYLGMWLCPHHFATIDGWLYNT